ncbi:predicted protein [Histoplasma mississippiense (nom. inval.)]|uniref:predicted protein n=1 Tax=Ajellomyces capsulatus (strain NAm1 / WU24) TaxID=2059318 RepID=UPI000157CC93|nr:predicted protein [Histoplasma mississippiense (nom. inval.)]EDN10094.1 predicted protein [Histoplasma mississippiense (nom. inval.)]
MPSRVEVSDDNYAISSKGSRNDTGYLTALPPEILREILQYVGADELRANNLDRLLISKYWYCIASAVLLEDVKLSATGLTKFLALQKREMATPGNSGPEHQPQYKEVTCTRARTVSESESELVDGPIGPISTRTSSLAICLTGYSGWAAHIDPETHQIIPERFKILADWTEKTRADMNRLSSWLGTLKTLTRFRFQAEGELSVRTIPENLFEHMKSYLHADAIALMCRSIPVERLRVLELDTCGSAFLARGVDGAKPGHASDSEHICPLIGRYVPYLQQLRVRMHRICPEVFGVGNKNNLQYTTARKEFVFHLSLCLISKATVLYPCLTRLISWPMDCRTGDTKMVDSQVDWLDNEDVVLKIGDLLIQRLECA